MSNLESYIKKNEVYLWTWASSCRQEIQSNIVSVIYKRLYFIDCYMILSMYTFLICILYIKFHLILHSYTGEINIDIL